MEYEILLTLRESMPAHREYEVNVIVLDLAGDSMLVDPLSTAESSCCYS